MAAKKAAKKADIDDLFSDLPDSSSAGGPTTASTGKDQAELDALADLNELEKLTERPSTPRVAGRKSAEVSRRAGGATPTVADSPRIAAEKKAETTPIKEDVPTPATAIVEAATPAATQMGSWWGGFVATATAAVKQAEQAVKEIQSSEETKKWTEQVKGNVGVLKSYGDGLRSRALPTLTNILNTIAPPISSHERLQIHITHDLRDYPSLDPLIHGVFARVMAQVEGGDLLVIQRGQESRSAGSDAAGNTIKASTAGWHDGPWWRAESIPGRSLNPVPGFAEGSKLCLAAAESYSKEFYAAHGGLEAAVTAASEPLNDDNPVRKSDIFLAIQAISGSVDVVAIGEQSSSDKEETISFAVTLRDEVHSLAFHALSQAVPKQWTDWLDSSEDSIKDIHEILSSGGVDPREWAAEWLEESISLAVGTVAQQYVARRMGIGLAKGKEKAVVG